MKAIIAVLIGLAAILVMPSTTPAQAPDTLWTRTYGGSRIEQARGVVELVDGGFVVAGYAYEESVSAMDVWWFKIDADGNMVKEHRSGYPGRDEGGLTIEPADDGGFFIGGHATNTEGHGEMYVIKIDSAGDGSWGFTYGTFGETSRARGIVSAHGGGAFAVGTQTVNEAGSEIYMVKTYPLGLLQFDELIAWSTWTDEANSVDRTSDGGYIITGRTNSFGEHSFGVFLQKVDASAYSAGMTLHNPTGDQTGNCVKSTSDGGYIIVGSHIAADRLDDDILILKADSAGAFPWLKHYGAGYVDVAQYVEEVQGGYIVVGSSYTMRELAMSRDVYVLRLDLNGDTLWTKYIGYPSTAETGFQIRQTADGGYIIAATRTLGSTNADAYVIRLAADPVTAAVPPERSVPDDFLLAQNYPNPFNPTTLIRYELPLASDVRLTVCDLLGREVAVLVSERRPAGSHAVQFNATGLPSGVYLCRLAAGDFLETRKMTFLK